MQNLTDLSTSSMESALRPLAEHLTCEYCQQSLRDRIRNLVVQWATVKVRILHTCCFRNIWPCSTKFYREQYDIHVPSKSTVTRRQGSIIFRAILSLLSATSQTRPRFHHRTLFCNTSLPLYTWYIHALSWCKTSITAARIIHYCIIFFVPSHKPRILDWFFLSLGSFLGIIIIMINHRHTRLDCSVVTCFSVLKYT